MHSHSKAFVGQLVTTTMCPRKRKQYFVHSFDKFKCIVAIFSRQYCNRNAPLSIQLLPSSTNHSLRLHYLAKDNAHYIITVTVSTQTKQRKQFNNNSVSGITQKKMYHFILQDNVAILSSISHFFATSCYLRLT